MVSIEGLDKAAVLKVLHDRARLTASAVNSPLSEAKAKAYIEAGQTRFDFVNARAVKCDIASSELDPAEYDKANGAGAAERAIADLRQRIEAATAAAAAAATQPAPEPQQVAEPAEASPATDPDPVSVTEPAPAPEHDLGESVSLAGTDDGEPGPDEPTAEHPSEPPASTD